MFDNVARYYGSVVGVKDVSFTIDSPGLYALLGHNGAGKTTTLRLMLGVLKPSRGKVLILGEEPSTNPEVRRIMGYVGEFPGLYEYLTVKQNLEYFCRLKYPKELCKELMDEITELLGLHDILYLKVRSLSRGSIQRVVIARALLGKPKIVVMDEPFSSLDPEWRRRMRRVLTGLAREGRVVIFSSHVLTEVELIADRYLILRKGKLVFNGSLNELKRYLSPRRHRVVIIKTKDPWKLVRSLRSRGVGVSARADSVEIEVPEESLNSILELLSESKVPVLDIKVVEPSLEELYLALEGLDHE